MFRERTPESFRTPLSIQLSTDEHMNVRKEPEAPGRTIQKDYREQNSGQPQNREQCLFPLARSGKPHNLQDVE